MSLGFAVSPVVLDLLVSKFDNTGEKNKAIEYDDFIECCLTVKGLTNKFKKKDMSYMGFATFTCEAFMLNTMLFSIYKDEYMELENIQLPGDDCYLPRAPNKLIRLYRRNNGRKVQGTK
ncbi:hypothetical protein L1887_17586 [Cichorium endivia]|nr:hypothetical protein L1887_17586 [Cichorium endivia]